MNIPVQKGTPGGGGGVGGFSKRGIKQTNLLDTFMIQNKLEPFPVSVRC